MRDDFVEMMKWALGQGWRSISFREIPKTWKELDSSRVDLEMFTQKETMSAHYFYIYQIMEEWVKFQKCKLEKEMKYERSFNMPFSFGLILSNLLQSFRQRKWFGRCGNY